MSEDAPPLNEQLFDKLSSLSTEEEQELVDAASLFRTFRLIAK